jgi:hypothetical protein
VVIEARSDEGDPTTAYRASGESLTANVTMTSPRLAGPLKYVTTYVRGN